MKNVKPSFEVWDKDISELPPGYQIIICRIIFYVNMGEKSRRKARLVADGHNTKATESITYSSVVSRDSVRISLTISALNDLDVLACNI